MAAAVLAAALAGGSAAAQEVPEPNPKIEFVDHAGVDLRQDTYRVSEQLLRVAGNAHGFGLTLNVAFPASLYYSSTYTLVTEGLINDALDTAKFRLYGPYVCDKQIMTPGGIGTGYACGTNGDLLQPDGTYIYWTAARGTTLRSNAAKTDFTFTSRNGTVTKFSGYPFNIHPTTVEFPDGEVWTYYYEGNGGRLRFLTTSQGYGLQYSYANNSTPSSLAWRRLSKVTLYNKTEHYCNEAALVDCAAIQNLASAVTFSYTAYQPSDMPYWQYADGAKVLITKPAGEKLELGIGRSDSMSTGMFDLRVLNRPDSPAENVTIEYGTWAGESGVVSHYINSVTRNGKTWTYQRCYPYPGVGCDTTATSPLGIQTILQDDGGYRMYVDGQHKLDYIPIAYADADIPYRINYPEGNYLLNVIDDRGNISTSKHVAKPGSGLSNIETNAVYPASCISPKSCNKPSSKTDARGNATSFTYDIAHGGVLTEISPAVSVNGGAGTVQPVKRYTYAQHYPWVKNSGGGYSQAASPIWLLTAERSCAATATNLPSGSNPGSCAGGAADEVITTYEYSAGSASLGSNILLRAKIVTADGVGLRTCFGYDRTGNKIYETTPRAGLASCN